jgi:hypothetical protein
MKLFSLITQVLAIMLGANISHGIIIRGPSTSDNNRFVGGPGATENGSFQYNTYDFSGVGWATSTPSQSITLISDQHFLAANHNKPTGTMSFRDTTGVVHTYSVSGYTIISNAAYPSLSGNSDLILGTLNTAVSANISYYSLLDPTLSPIGQDTLIYGQNGRVGESSIVDVLEAEVDHGGALGIVQGVVTESKYVIAAGSPDDAYFTGGDSGGPSFIVGNDNNLILSGVHWAQDSDDENQYLYDTYSSAYINQLNSVSGLTVTTSLIPEPSTGMLLGFAVIAISFKRRR